MPTSQRSPAASSAAIGIFVLVVAGTLALMRAPDPEQATIRSEDGTVSITGTWAIGSSPSIQPGWGEGPTRAMASEYVIAGVPAPVGRPYKLVFEIPASLAGQTTAIYLFDSVLGAWRAVPFSADASGWGLVTERASLPSARWAVGATADPLPSAHAFAALRSLVAVPPPGAVGYRAAFLSAALAADDYIVARDPFGTGGCEGRFQSGTEQTKTSLDASETERVVVVWELGTGCTPGAVITPVVRDPS